MRIRCNRPKTHSSGLFCASSVLQRGGVDLYLHWGAGLFLTYGVGGWSCPDRLVNGHSEFPRHFVRLISHSACCVCKAFFEFCCPSSTRHFRHDFSGVESRGPRNGAFGKPCLCPRDTRHFRHFRRFAGFEQQNPCFIG